MANVLIVMALGPLITAFFTYIFLRHRLPVMTWLAIVLAGLGIFWMFSHGEEAASSLTGFLIACAVPLAAVVNYTLLQLVGRDRVKGGDPDKVPAQDMMQAVLIGAILSAVYCLPLSIPFQASAHDLGLLSFLGVFQLALPCLLVVRVSRELTAPEISLLTLQLSFLAFPVDHTIEPGYNLILLVCDQNIIRA